MFIASFLPLFTDLVPAFAILESFAPQLAGVGLALTLPALLFRPRWFALLGPIALAWNLVILWPYLPLGGASVAATKAPVLKVVSANVWYRNDSYAAALNYFAASNADVIAVIEGTSQWKKALEPLYAKYPYRIDCVDAMPPCEALLLSKYPFRKSFAGQIDGRAPVVLWGEIEFAGKPIVVAATHLSWPLRAASGNARATTSATLQPPPLAGSDPLVQSQQAQNLAQYLAGLGPDLVLMGDFNSVPWGGTQTALRKATGLENDGPMVPTWPSWEPPWFLRLPIDQIMTRGALTRRDFRSGRYIGSDHLPVEAEIA
ncbi:MAG: endonuclease/exonuclease/phosphatase family protein, partial [Asticcacaulis sp.]|nr:endonuclease/exonuclease/phosphatase family protein [Asticcacaulis sp.]